MDDNNISIHALLAESDQDLIAKELALAAISIHALLAESDTAANEAATTANISIHALLAESDGRHIDGSPAAVCNFYPRSPCGERLLCTPIPQIYPVISIHALLAESDIDSSRAASFQHHFYPRSPCGERLLHQHVERDHPAISIHALLAESDSWQKMWNTTKLISIHALLAESDLARQKACKANCEFLSTLSLRRATTFLQIDIA